MKLSIRHNGSYVAEFNRIEVSGRKAIGGYAFIFTLHGNGNKFDEVVTAYGFSLSLSSEDHVPIVFGIPAQTGVRKYGYSGDEQLHFQCVLTGSQIQAIEDYRVDRDLNLHVGLSVVTNYKQESWDSYEHEKISIPRQQWLKALEGSRYRDIMLFEIPLPFMDEMDDSIKENIIRAQDLINHGDYRNAITECRRVLEKLEKIRSDKGDVVEISRRVKGGKKEELSILERLLYLREQIKVVSHVAVHDDENFTRSQARTVLGATLLMLSEPTIGVPRTKENVDI